MEGLSELFEMDAMQLSTRIQTIACDHMFARDFSPTAHLVKLSLDMARKGALSDLHTALLLANVMQMYAEESSKRLLRTLASTPFPYELKTKTDQKTDQLEGNAGEPRGGA